jgi:hypothetical protein
MEPIGVSHFFDDIIKAWQPAANDLHAYYLNISHEFPPDDTGTSPPVTYTHKITRFFNTHPRNYRETVYPAPSRGKPFRDDFEQNSTLLSYPRWRTISADTTGRFGGVQGARFAISNGKLTNEPTDVVKQSGFKDPIATFAFTDFMPAPFSWSTSFIIETGGKELRVYPCLLRDMQGRIIYLSITPDGWLWNWAETHLAFHSEYSQRIHALAQGNHLFHEGKQYGVVVEYQAGGARWEILDADDKSIANGVLPAVVPYLDEAEVGLGVRGLPSQKVSFDFARVM